MKGDEDKMKVIGDTLVFAYSGEPGPFHLLYLLRLLLTCIQATLFNSQSTLRRI